MVSAHDRHRQLNLGQPKLDTVIPQSPASINFTQQVSDRRLLANPRSVGGVVRDIVSHSVHVVWGESVLESGQWQKGSVGLALGIGIVAFVALALL
jgi:hypothetical protein